MNERLKWHRSIGICENLLGLHVRKTGTLVCYSKARTDITFKYPYGVQELEGVAALVNLDLVQHQSCSGQSMEYFDQNTKRQYILHVTELAEGADRILLAVVCSAYHEGNVDDEVRTVLKIVPRVALSKRRYFRWWNTIPKSSAGHRK
jgi:glycyl-tRNA synthetase